MWTISAFLRRRFSAALPYIPLVGHIVPTLVIGFGFVIPGSPIDGVNMYTLGFLGAVVGFVPAYVSGVAIARRLARRA